MPIHKTARGMERRASSAEILLKSLPFFMSSDNSENILFRPLTDFIHTSLPSKAVMKFYQNRGTMENLIKEGKQGFAFDQLSSTRFEANAAKLQMQVLANNFQVGFRLLCLPNSMKKKVLRMDTVRLRLIEIAGKLVRSGRSLIFRLCSHCLYQKEFWQTLDQIRRIPTLE
ncbi:MAG: transposase [Sporolactobacillus sp.]